MIPSSVRAKRAETRRARLALISIFVPLELAGLYWAPNQDAVTGYTLLTISALLPCVLWFRAGMPGIPIWPAVSVMSWLYYALPILRDRQEKLTYTPDDALYLAATVAAYLTLATVPWTLMLVSRRGRGQDTSDAIMASQIKVIVFLGLGLGLAFSALIYLGTLSFLGSFFGLVRSAMGTSSLVGCYMLGCARGSGILRGTKGALAFALLGVNVLLAWNSLYLVAGMTYLLAAAAGYVITTKRVPWLTLLGTGLILTVLHAGKGGMRDKYWVQGNNEHAEQNLSITKAPEFFTEWFLGGLTALADDQKGAAIVDRASLFGLLLKVQQLAPAYVPYLHGETYALLPRMLVPRFLSPEKITSQEGMSELNIHFGFQSREDTQSTAIGWGVIAEAYANFGFVGVLAIGFIMGTIAGFFTRWSCGAAPISVGTLMGIIALMSMVYLEADFSFFITNLWQACASVLILVAALRWNGIRTRRRGYRSFRAVRLSFANNPNPLTGKWHDA